MYIHKEIAYVINLGFGKNINFDNKPKKYFTLRVLFSLYL